VSILMAAGMVVGLCRGGSPALNTSMMRMAAPQHGHGLAGVAGSEVASSGSGAGGATSSSLRARARWRALLDLRKLEAADVVAGRSVGERPAIRAAVLSRRPPQSWLAGEREEWRDYVSPSAFIAPGAGRGNYWGPI
jgi:hypothetical protein